MPLDNDEQIVNCNFSPEIRGVDCHAHVMKLDAPLIPGRHSQPARDVDVSEFLSLLDQHGLTHGVLTQPSFYGTDNSILLEALASNRQRLRGTAIVNETISQTELDKLRNENIVGLRLNWLQKADRPDTSSVDFQRFLCRVADADLHIEIYLEGALLAAVLPNLRRSGARVVVDHFGSPNPEQRLECAGFQAVLDGVEAKQVWVKLSAPYRLGGVDPKLYVDALLSRGGPEQLLWASDWPWISYEKGQNYADCLAALTRWVPDEAQRHTILAHSPRKIMKFIG